MKAYVEEGCRFPLPAESLCIIMLVVGMPLNHYLVSSPPILSLKSSRIRLLGEVDLIDLILESAGNGCPAVKSVPPLAGKLTGASEPDKIVITWRYRLSWIMCSII